jgi:hypothetical protein
MNKPITSAREMEAQYPEFVAQIRAAATAAARARAKREYTPSDHEDGEKLMEHAAERRRARTHAQGETR